MPGKRYSLLLLLLPLYMNAQTDTASAGSDELMKILNEEPATAQKEFTAATFKSTRVANSQSIENTGKGVLDFRISHRFGEINQGIENFFGLDNATTRIGFDYGITSWLMIGVGRSTYLKEYDGCFKIKLLRQTENNRMPFSLSYVASGSVQGNKVMLPPGETYKFSNRVAYINQVLIARKFNQWLSLQLMPSYLHYNLVDFRDEPNDIFSIGIGGRLKLSNRISLNAEYYYNLQSLKDTRNSLTISFDLETGGHVFQLMFTNSTGITERTFIGQTTGDFFDGDIHFGFNISRVFTIVRPKEFKDSRNKIW